MHFVQVLCDAFHQVGHRHTDGPGSVALQLDDLIGPAVHKHTLTQVFLPEADWKQPIDAQTDRQENLINAELKIKELLDNLIV